jgi:hypothetical protein
MGPLEVQDDMGRTPTWSRRVVEHSGAAGPDIHKKIRAAD